MKNHADRGICISISNTIQIKSLFYYLKYRISASVQKKRERRRKFYKMLLRRFVIRQMSLISGMFHPLLCSTASGLHMQWNWTNYKLSGSTTSNHQVSLRDGIFKGVYVFLPLLSEVWKTFSSSVLQDEIEKGRCLLATLEKTTTTFQFEFYHRDRQLSEVFGRWRQERHRRRARRK